ncbi:MAG: long-chain fatty acid--CoA ligase, partial [Campylobacterales bacterium]|nr:long-chain fatty acid--CoA ligase [Campylobacterales bacterium]
MSWFIENFKKFDKKLAIVFKNQSYTYSELYNQIEIIEDKLLSQIKKGEVVSILSDYSFESIALLIA